MPWSGNPGAETEDERAVLWMRKNQGIVWGENQRWFPILMLFLGDKTMGHERFTSDHFYEQRVVSLHGESGGLKIRRERVGTVTTHLAPWSKG